MRYCPPTATQSWGDSSGANLNAASYIAAVDGRNLYSSRTVPGKVQVMGLAKDYAQVEVNSSVASRKGTYFRSEVSVSNSSSSVYQSIDVEVSYGGQQSTESGSTFVPKTPEAFTYDANGNLTSDGRWDYTWDVENRLIQMATKSGVAGPAKRLEFRYDYMGRRIQKNVYNYNSVWTLQESRVYLYEGWNLIAEFDGSQSNALLRTYTWGLDLSGSRHEAGGTGGLLIVQDHEGASPENHFAAYDGNGNVVGLINSETGEKSATYEYSPFGELIRVSGEMGMKNPIRYSSRYTDDETGLLYYGYRYYSPALGKWLSADPIEESGGMNVFGFLGNDPVNGVDVLGMVGGFGGNWDFGTGWVWQDNRTEYEKALDAIKELELAEWMTWQTIDMLAGEEGVKALMEGKIFFGVVIFGKDFVIGKVTKIFKLGKGIAKKAYGYCCTNIRAKLSKVKAFLVEKTGIKRLCSNAPREGVHPGTPVGRTGSWTDTSQFTGNTVKESRELTVAGARAGAPPINSPATVGGRQYSGHALDRMQQRGYVPSVVEDAIQSGTMKPSYGGASSYYSLANNLTVIVDDASGRVVIVRGGR